MSKEKKISDLPDVIKGEPIKDPVADGWEHKGKQKLKLLACFKCGSQSFFEVVNVTERFTIPPQKPRVFKCLSCDKVQHAQQMIVKE